MIFDKVSEISYPSTFLKINNFINNTIYLKIESLNLSGSIKLKTAKFLIKDLEKKYGEELPQKKIIESSSGNLGIALAMLCNQKGYSFTCVTDPNASIDSIRTIQSLGSEIHVVKDKDGNNGYLQSRINHIRKIIDNDSSYVWTNQYENQCNLEAHFNTTAVEIHTEFGDLIDYIFIGTGTSGTATGCARYFNKLGAKTKIIAVEPVGSVTYGTPSARRKLPGIGASMKPKISTLENVYDVVYVREEETIKTCHYIALNYSLLVGASTGSVFSAIKKYKNNFNKNCKIVAISPDMGEKYLDTIYSKTWLARNYSLG